MGASDNTEELLKKQQQPTNG